MAKKKSVDGLKDSERDKWLRKIADENKAHKVWRDRAKTADDAYCNYQTEAANPKYPTLYTTINLIHGKIYGHSPKPDIRKRHPASPLGASAPQTAIQQPPALLTGPALGNPTGGMVNSAANAGAGQPTQGAQSAPPQISAGSGQVPQPTQNIAPQAGINAGVAAQAQIMGAVQQPLVPLAPQEQDDNIIAITLERSLNFTIDNTGFDRDGHAAVNDYLIAGCGNAKVEMETEFDWIPVVNPVSGQPLLDEEGQPINKKVISNQELHLRHFHWSQFRWEPCKDWKRCGWVCFDHYMTADDIEDEFDITINSAGGGSGAGQSDAEPSLKPPQMDKYDDTYVVHEIWNKRKRERLWITEAYPAVLDKEDDPLELEDFFPCPAPMMSNVSGRELLPSPDYWEYEFLAKQAHELADRIDKITRQIKDISFYDQSFAELKQKENYDDGAMIAVKQLLSKLQATDGKADADSIIFQLPMQDKVAVLQELQNQLSIVEQRIEKINGIADIQQGVSNPSDTATAQTIKNQWADIRTGQRIQTVNLWQRDIFRIMTELVASKFDINQIETMSGIQLSDNQIAVMRSDLATGYSVDVETDSTVVGNDQQDQQSLTQFLSIFGQYLEQTQKAVQMGAMPADLQKEILSMITDTFKPGRNMQQAIDALPSTMAQLQQMTQQNQQSQQQIQGLQAQNQQLQKQLMDYNAQEQMRENQEAQSKIQERNVDTAAKAQKLKTDGIVDAARASQISREDMIQGITTGIQ